eukprot:747071-Hanusia_phi.AAC.2
MRVDRIRRRTPEISKFFVQTPGIAAGAGAGVNLKVKTASVGCTRLKTLQEHQYLAVSRTFGDTDLKQPNKIVVSDPEIKVPLSCSVDRWLKSSQVLDITAKDSFIVMACDGIWDMLDDQVRLKASRELAMADPVVGGSRHCWGTLRSPTGCCRFRGAYSLPER